MARRADVQPSEPRRAIEIDSTSVRRDSTGPVDPLGVSSGAPPEGRSRPDTGRGRRYLHASECQFSRAAPSPMIYSDVSKTVGRTPLVDLARIGRGLPGRIVGKLEMRNPCGSVKDRLGVALIDDAEKRGRLRPGMTIVEPTGGNTGIGLAFVSAIRGYRLILTMPSTMSAERVALLRHLGAEVVLTPGIMMEEAVRKARHLVEEHPEYVLLDQFGNPANPEIHRTTTALEIWDDTDGAIDVFVSAVGTGGTITGVGEVLKAKKPTVRVVLVEPAGAALFSGDRVGRSHRIPGIGPGFFPETLNLAVYDEVIAVTDENAFECARRLARTEGIIAGPSSGAAVHAAMSVASRTESRGMMIVVILPDTGERYISSDLFPPASHDRGVGPTSKMGQ
jgi:cysteine synthase